LSGCGMRCLMAARAAEIVEIDNNESDFDQIRQSYLRFYDLNLDEFDGVISAKAPSYVVRHRNHVCYLMHTMSCILRYVRIRFSEADPSKLSDRGD